MRSLRRLLLLALLTTTLSGCLRLAKSYPERHEYLLAAERTAPARGNGGADTVLAVQPFRSSPAFAKRPFLVKSGPSQFEPDFYHLFLVPPDRNVTEVAASWLDASGVFGQVVPSSSAAPPTHVLEGRVVSLHGEYGAQPAAHLTLQATLLDLRGNAPKVALHRTYEETAPLAKGTPEALADGWNRALAAVLTRLETDIAAAQ
ncbi:MAG: cholesterol transport system auxiliary component [Candidatus Sumerlaeota bacterium]|nr:cholesterol transport system auxiliary component [Candidatus Sumerlaeota bacterium]